MRTTPEDRHGAVLAVRLRRAIADRLDEAAEHVGGYGKAIEMMATEQELPRDWLREHPGDVPGPHERRITFRLSTRAARSLRAWAGRRPLSKVIRHLVLYTFTDGRRAAAGRAPLGGPLSPARASAIRSAPAAPSPPRSPAPPNARPPVPQLAPSQAQPPGRLSAAEAFSHLPPPRAGLPYVCEVPGCEFGAGSGTVVRCHNHVRWVAPAFSHLPALPMGKRYICQLSSCRFSQGDGVSTGAMMVPAWCRKHAP